MKLKFIYLSNPPVNALSAKLRTDLLDQVKRAEKDVRVNGIVIEGKGSMFCGGADIKEFDSGGFAEGPTIHEIIEKLARCRKPTIAAIHGTALGGGLELALGCQYRVALASTSFGLPEINLGLLPAGGGTQLLPRLIGLDHAMRIITTGKHFGAVEAHKLGIVDYLTETKDNIEGLCEEICQNHKPNEVDCLLDRPVKDGHMADEIYNKHLSIVRKRWRGAVAPIECLKLTRKSCQLSFHEGSQAESDAFIRLCAGSESQALRYIFFAERAQKRWSTEDGISADTETADINKVAVIGLGTMGATIVICFLKLGLPVYVLDTGESRTNVGIQYIQMMIADMLGSEVISQQKADAMEANIHKCTAYNQLKQVDLVVEAVFESMEVKKDVFRSLNRHCKPTAILATNTSTLNINKLAKCTDRPDKVIGMHFFAPAHRMKLLENVRGTKTSPKTIATAMKIGFALRKSTILVKNCHGFVVNRMYAHFITESEFLLEEGAYPEQIDRALKKLGFPMGRFEVTDVAGNDVGYRVRESQGLLIKQQPSGSNDRIRSDYRYCPLTEVIVEAGRNGYKTDLKGWFKYDAPFSPPQVDPQVSRLIEKYRAKHGIKARKISDKEILDRMLLSMVNEGFKILHEGICSSPMDIDLAWINGMGWPKHTGGPMYYAYTKRLPVVLKFILDRWNLSDGRELHWKPSLMLINLVNQHRNPPIEKWIKLSQEEDIISQAEDYIHFIDKHMDAWKTRNYGRKNFANMTATPMKKISLLTSTNVGGAIAALFCIKLDVPVKVLDVSSSTRNAIGSLYELTPEAVYSDDPYSCTPSSPTFIHKHIHTSLPHSQLEKLFFHGCDLVVEVVDDEEEMKKEMLGYIEAYSKPNTIIVTCTKLLTVDQIASWVSNPRQVVGMNFSSPAHEIPLIEIVKGSMTSSQTAVTAMNIGMKLRRTAILVRDGPGFMINRIFQVFLNESEFLLEEGCYPEDIDEALKDFGFAYGRFEMSDAFGNDVGYKIEKSLQIKNQHQSSNSRRTSELTEELIKEGRCGYKSNYRGWYKYENQDGKIVGHSDPKVHQLIDAYRKKRAIIPRTIDTREILDRLIFSVVNEGFKILEEKIAYSPHDIDVAWLFGAFWPKQFGGPMYYAHSYGLCAILEEIEARYEKVAEPQWKPSQMMQDLARRFENIPDIADWMSAISSLSETRQI